MGARPWETLETAVQNLKLGKGQLLSQEDKENLAGCFFYIYFLKISVFCVLFCFNPLFNMYIFV